MVGVPRSTGCQLCRKRRVKCDEARPACGNCRKYGVECPGYERDIKFVSGKHQIRQRGKRGDGNNSSSLGSVASASASGSSSAGSLTPPSEASPPSVDDALVRALRPNRAEFISTIIATVRTDITQSDVSGFLSWVDLGRLGSRVVLDGAMSSLALHLVGKERADEDMIAYSRDVYGKSLVALQSSLRHETEWRSSETLCAAMLLCVFELFAGTSSADSWLAHAKGIGTLMKQRGPAAHATGWDASMLLAFRGVLIMCDMFFPQSDTCFLSLPEWKPVMRDAGRRLIHPPGQPDHVIHIADNFFACLAELPAILMPAYVLRESRAMGTVHEPEPAKLAALARRALRCRGHFVQWYKEFKTLSVMPEEVPTRDPTSPFASVLRYRVSWVGSMHMGYWASMLILQDALVQCRHWALDAEARARREELTSNILRSLETVGAGTMGPYRVGFAVRIAYEVASPEHQRWVLSLLDRFKKTYAATDRATYPEPRSEDEQWE